ncbi:hypothetical protein [Pseudomonas sp. S1(2024)]|uniref:hypothetical protein n=1 Tax=Pseudomonas sp. S1(2024) TaxID=3390191 RepID=UPI00397C1BEE
MTECAKDFECWLWAGDVYTALEPVGGTFTPEGVAQLLGMSNMEVVERIEERSILPIRIVDMNSGSILIPAFQFAGTTHVPHFHDVWDRLDPGCRVERICQFFAHETFADTGVRIIDVLRKCPSTEVVQAIVEQADAFKAWCAQSDIDHRQTFCFTSDRILSAIKNNTIAYVDEQLVEVPEQTRDGFRVVRGELVGTTAWKVKGFLKSLVIMTLECVCMVLELVLGGLLFPIYVMKCWELRSLLVRTKMLVFMFIGRGVLFILYIALIIGWCAGWF